MLDNSLAGIVYFVSSRCLFFTYVKCVRVWWLCLSSNSGFQERKNGAVKVEALLYGLEMPCFKSLLYPTWQITAHAAHPGELLPPQLAFP